jgi:hypothetical protein
VGTTPKKLLPKSESPPVKKMAGGGAFEGYTKMVPVSISKVMWLWSFVVKHQTCGCTSQKFPEMPISGNRAHPKCLFRPRAR